MRKVFLAAAIAMALPAAASAATIITFDEASLGDTSTPFSDPFITSAYFGFAWDNFVVLDPNEWAGWDASAANSSPNVAVNAFGLPADFTRSSAFDFVSAYFANGLNGVTITVNGRDTVGGAVTHTATFDTSATPTLQTLNWTGVQEIDFSSSPIGGAGASHFSMDDVTVSLPGGVPEPTAWTLMLAGFLGLGGLLRRRRLVAAA